MMKCNNVLGELRAREIGVRNRSKSFMKLPARVVGHFREFRKVDDRIAKSRILGFDCLGELLLGWSEPSDQPDSTFFSFELWELGYCGDGKIKMVEQFHVRRGCDEPRNPYEEWVRHISDDWIGLTVSQSEDGNLFVVTATTVLFPEEVLVALIPNRRFAATTNPGVCSMMVQPGDGIFPENMGQDPNTGIYSICRKIGRHSLMFLSVQLPRRTSNDESNDGNGVVPISPFFYHAKTKKRFSMKQTCRWKWWTDGDYRTWGSSDGDFAPCVRTHHVLDIQCLLDRCLIVDLGLNVNSSVWNNVDDAWHVCNPDHKCENKITFQKPKKRIKMASLKLTDFEFKVEGMYSDGRFVVLLCVVRLQTDGMEDDVDEMLDIGLRLKVDTRTGSYRILEKQQAAPVRATLSVLANRKLSTRLYSYAKKFAPLVPGGQDRVWTWDPLSNTRGVDQLRNPKYPVKIVM